MGPITAPSPPGWYPDPGRAHEARYFDGNAWTDHVADAGRVDDAPLGAPPPGLIGWAPPHVMVQSATALPPLVEVPRRKMWVLAALSVFVFWLNTPGIRIVLPIGVLFAIWCWRATAEAFISHRDAGSPMVTDIRVARWVAVGFAMFSLLQVALWTR